MFIHLNVHSTYSPMHGIASQEDLIFKALECNMSHLALTEVNGLWGFINFVKEARHYDINPIAGTNLLTDDLDFILLAENQTGYENICHILSVLHHEESDDMLETVIKYQEGVFILCSIPAMLQRLAERIPGDHLFAELRPGAPTRELLDAARQLNLDPVATGNVYFLTPDQQPLHRLLRAIDGNCRLDDLADDEVKSTAHYFVTEAEMHRRYPQYPEAIENTYRLAKRCKTDWKYDGSIFPETAPDKLEKSTHKLRQLVQNGARERYGYLSPAIQERIDREMSLITEKGFAPYFLVVRDIVQQATKTVGRGSAAASIISYCLGITQVDPIKYNLYFERFLHEERVDPPDIDIDFAWDERDDILDYVFAKYGETRAAMVSNQVRLQPRSAVREAAKVYGLSNEEINAITKRLGYRSVIGDNLLDTVRNDNHFRNLHLSETLEKVLAQSERILGVFRHSSVHSGGVVIVPEDIRRYVPVLRATKGVQIVEWEKDQVEDAGLVKIDLLGNRSLAVARDALEQINANNGTHLKYDDINAVEDQRTVEMMEAGQTTGVFYIESPATRQLLAKAAHVDFEHVVIYSSVIRPAANRYIDVLIERIHGEPWELIHPDLDFLNESYGVMVYEEQVSITGRVMAGMSYQESDRLRKIMSRNARPWEIEEITDRFYDGAREHGYDEELIDQIWDMIKSFSGYSFNKPHSASYAMLSFKCAYLKAHYPAEFLAAVVTNQGGFYSAYAYLSEAKRLGVSLRLPDINESEMGYLGDGDTILIGFMQISEINQKSLEAVLDEREAHGDFTSLGDFLSRVSIPLEDVKLLIKAGCFDRLAPDRSRPELTYQAMEYYYRKSASTIMQSVGADAEPPAMPEVEERDAYRMEIESFGFPVSQHPLDHYEWYVGPRTIKARNIGAYVGKRVNLAGINITRKAIRTRGGERMEFLTFEDQTDIFECVLFPEAYERYNDLVRWEQLFVLQGTVEENFGVYSVTIHKMQSLDRSLEKWKKRKGSAAFA
ncbi:MAG: DNA polymerase III subunit alpha [Candidatus Marinimicrobia bacterium]|nr:DNA polymerase III subunit alpha [Candidatus Neomarinimicrobiota bacterium]MCF7828416.1 DNA polymerase III subunit alpha [Candidatus Neomarinimicrobiota bacterium]MCF7880990.1 DNA polymerase III subunit alpha [Candidatus Neomarinimicrobiota bacterium]